MNYNKNKPSMPLAITVPHYNAVEFLSVASHLTSQGHLTPKMQLRDLLSEWI